MTNTELRAKYGDKVSTDYYQYPDHFFSPKDHFTMHIPMWSSYFTRFQNQSDLLFLEIGTGHGRSSVWLLENVLTEPTSRIITVDIQDDRLFKKEDLSSEYESDVNVSVSKNLKPYVDQGKCEFHVKDSKEFFRQLYGGVLKTNFNLQNPIGAFDFVYLDGSHDPDYVMYESAISFELLKPGGFLLFDDYGWGNCRFGIEAFLLCYKDKYKLLVKDWQVLIEKV
jgi:hypothetical protein